MRLGTDTQNANFNLLSERYPDTIYYILVKNFSFLRIFLIDWKGSELFPFHKIVYQEEQGVAAKGGNQNCTSTSAFVIWVMILHERAFCPQK